MTHAEYDVVAAIEEGASVFRPESVGPGIEATFQLKPGHEGLLRRTFNFPTGSSTAGYD